MYLIPRVKDIHFSVNFGRAMSFWLLILGLNALVKAEEISNPYQYNPEAPLPFALQSWAAKYELKSKIYGATERVPISYIYKKQ